MRADTVFSKANARHSVHYWALVALVFVIGVLPISYAGTVARSPEPAAAFQARERAGPTALNNGVATLQRQAQIANPPEQAQKQNRLATPAAQGPEKAPATLPVLPAAPSQNADHPAVDLPVTSVRVHKSARRLELLNGERVLRAYPVALGGNPIGHKQQEGDMRTPEGRYVLDWRNAESQYYRSIHVSYPDRADREAARKRGVDPGGDIMIHGQPNGWTQWVVGIRSDWTHGCIAVTNEHMSEIWAMVKDGTPIEISP